jgi:hypothetical protein
MSKSTTDIASSAVREIEPELRELFTKVVEHDPYEAVKMLEPYPDEFVVKMLDPPGPTRPTRARERGSLSGAIVGEKFCALSHSMCSLE